MLLYHSVIEVILRLIEKYEDVVGYEINLSIKPSGDGTLLYTPLSSIIINFEGMLLVQISEAQILIRIGFALGLDPDLDFLVGFILGNMDLDVRLKLGFIWLIYNTVVIIILSF